MKNISRIILTFFIFLFTLNFASAFGYFRHSDMYDLMGFPGFGFLVGFGIAAILLGLFLFIFWLSMLIDCLKRDFKKDYEKIVWVLVMIFLHLLGAIIYYFVVKVSDKKAVAKEKKKNN